MRYQVHQFDLATARDRHDLEDFLNGLEGEVISVLPDLTGFPAVPLPVVWIIERIDEAWIPRRDRGEREPEDIAVP